MVFAPHSNDLGERERSFARFLPPRDRSNPPRPISAVERPIRVPSRRRFAGSRLPIGPSPILQACRGLCQILPESFPQSHFRTPPPVFSTPAVGARRDLHIVRSQPCDSFQNDWSHREA